MSNSTQITPIIPEDEPFLWRMLFEAAHMGEQAGATIDAAKSSPNLAKYVAQWGQPDDFGFKALDTVLSQPVGAVWARRFSSQNPGYAYVNDNIPELAIAVLSQYSGQGIGTQLLQHFLKKASATYPAVSLSVRLDNPAFRLYRRLGFQVLAGTEITNRVGSTSCTMLIAFEQGKQ